MLAVVVAVVALFHVFWWPLTNVYMYCSYFSIPREIRAGHPRADFHEAAAAQRIAQGYLKSRPPVEATERFSFLPELRLVGEGSEPYSFQDIPGVPSLKQWVLTTLRPVLIEDLATKPAGRIDFDPEQPDLPAQRLLLEYLPALLRQADPSFLGEYERLELTYPLSEGKVVITSVPLDWTEVSAR